MTLLGFHVNKVTVIIAQIRLCECDLLVHFMDTAMHTLYNSLQNQWSSYQYISVPLGITVKLNYTPTYFVNDKPYISLKNSSWKAHVSIATNTWMMSIDWSSLRFLQGCFEEKMMNTDFPVCLLRVCTRGLLV